MFDLAAAFVGGLLVGVMVNIVVPVGVHTTTVFPTPANSNFIVYQDPSGVCHSPHVEDTDCVPGAQPIPAQA